MGWGKKTEPAESPEDAYWRGRRDEEIEVSERLRQATDDGAYDGARFSLGTPNEPVWADQPGRRRLWWAERVLYAAAFEEAKAVAIAANNKEVPDEGQESQAAAPQR